MSEEQRWTPARGIRTALLILGTRLLGGFAVYTVIMYYAWRVGEFVPPRPIMLAIWGVFAFGLGYPLGLVASRRLVERSGFAGLLLVGIASCCLASMFLVSHHLVTALRGDAGMFGVTMAVCMAVSSIFACTKAVMLD